MRRSLVIACMIFFSQISLASRHAILEMPSSPIEPPANLNHGPLQQPSQGTFFAELKELFDAGEVPTPSDVLGWRSGRCYSIAMPDVPMNHLLTGNDIVASPTLTKFIIVPIHDRRESPEYYDLLSPAQLSQVANMVKAAVAHITSATVVDQSLVSQFPEGNLEYRIRKNKDYLLMKAVTMEAAPSMNLAAGETYAHCYAFQKLEAPHNELSEDEMASESDF